MDKIDIASFTLISIYIGVTFIFLKVKAKKNHEYLDNEKLEAGIKEFFKSDIKAPVVIANALIIFDSPKIYAVKASLFGVILCVVLPVFSLFIIEEFTDFNTSHYYENAILQLFTYLICMSIGVGDTTRKVVRFEEYSKQYQKYLFSK